MKQKKTKLIAVLLFGLGLTGLQAQTMNVKENNGTLTAYTISNIQKINFLNGNFTVTKTDNSIEVYGLSDLRYLNFTDFSVGFNEPLVFQKEILSVYPNPTNNVLKVNLSETGIITIINFEGKTVTSQQVSNAGVHTFDISHLPKGIYLCLYVGETATRTVQIIKQ